MVKIVSREMQPLPQPNYTGYSRGAKADMSGKIMGKGFSNVISQLAGVGEYMIQKDMDTTVTSAVDALDKQLGFDGGPPGGPENILPESVRNEYDNTLSSLTAAKNQGKLTQEEYVMRLREVQKGLNAKYPGAQTEIAAIFSKRTGMVPAIEARRILFKKQAAAQREAIKERQNFGRLLEKAADKGVINPKEAEIMFRGGMADPEKRREYEIIITKRLSARGQIEAEKSYLELQAKRGQVEKQQTEKVAGKLAADYTRNFLDGAIKATTGTYSINGLRKMVEDYTKDGVVDPNEQRTLEMTAFKLQEGFKAGLMKLLYEPSSKGGKSLAEMLGPEETQKFIDNQVKTFVSNFVTPLTGKKIQIDLFEMNKRTIDAVENFSALKMYGREPVLQTVSGLRKILGENYGLIMKNNKKFQNLLRGVDNYDGTWVQFNLGRALQNGESVTEALKRNGEAYSENPKRLPEVNSATISMAIDAFTNKDVDADGRLKSGKFLFSDPDLLSKIKPEERQKLFDELVNPETVKAASQLAKQDPDFGEKFADFVTRSSTIVLRRQFDEVKKNAETLGIKLVFDNGKFAIDDTGVDKRETFYGGGGFVPGFQSNQTTNAQLVEMQVERLNQKLDTLNKALHGVGANGKKFIERLSFAFVPEAFPEQQQEQRQDEGGAVEQTGEKPPVPQPRPENLDTGVDNTPPPVPRPRPEGIGKKSEDVSETQVNQQAMDTSNDEAQKAAYQAMNAYDKFKTAGFRKSSIRRVRGVDENLLSAVADARKELGVNFEIGYLGGKRTVADQRRLVAKGASKTMRSKHIKGKAIDIAVYDDNGKYVANNPKMYEKVARYVIKKLAEQGIRARWGGDWKSFKDYAHIEIIGKTRLAKS